eukprot:CAMPEP_0115672740 /NCGR_PEP_ID=MMETSP0272-20121206/52740_1 /TAXON_ID=71861 /ORGANISM="Scrippsiella trochoidea, Strain CCMP3099" /LENGTH=89 /DNA_ID=CAMNT_0003111585 /DNA_START=32 /DNA_END=298 /DNA_ORIENTATION=-
MDKRRARLRVSSGSHRLSAPGKSTCTQLQMQMCPLQHASEKWRQEKTKPLGKQSYQHPPSLGSADGGDDVDELGLQRGAAHEEAVDVRA